jgi:hypothetical protein
MPPSLVPAMGKSITRLQVATSMSPSIPATLPWSALLVLGLVSLGGIALAAPQDATPAVDRAVDPRAAHGIEELTWLALDARPSWRDLACLAGIGNTKGAVLSYPTNAESVSEDRQNFLRFAKPAHAAQVPTTEKTRAFGALARRDRPEPLSERPMHDAVEVALRLCEAHLGKQNGDSRPLVISDSADYSASLIAAGLARRLGGGFLFIAGDEVPEPVRKMASRTSRVLLIGNIEERWRAAHDQGTGSPNWTSLPGAMAVGTWLREQGMKVEYLAVTNPKDRGAKIGDRMSLAAPLLAGSRNGLVLPIAMDVRWKLPFASSPLPKGLSNPKKNDAQTVRIRTGRVEMEGLALDFVLEGQGKQYSFKRAWFDLNHNGRFDDPGEGPFGNTSRLQLGDTRWIVLVGSKSGPGNAELFLSYPHDEQIQTEIRRHVQGLGGEPTLLCMVGWPQTLPQVIGPPWQTDVPSDYPYANLDEDPFVELGVSRFIGETPHAAVMQASRSVAYEQLIGGPWTKTYATAGMSSEGVEQFKAAGFEPLPHHVEPVIQDPASPVLGAALITHRDHSGPSVMGKCFAYKHDLLFAPAFVSTSGCSTHQLDVQAQPRSLQAKLLRNGVVATIGNTRLGVGQQGHFRSVMHDRLLQGDRIGDAYRHAINAAILTAMTRNEMQRGGMNRYSVYNSTVFADPAIRLRMPHRPRARAARQSVETAGSRVTVFGPGTWWREEQRYPAEWGYTGDRIYLWRGLGTGVAARWHPGKKRNDEESYFIASFHTDKAITGIRQLRETAKPLGWDGKFFVDEHPGGTRTAYWRVRLIHYDKDSGKVLAKLRRVGFEVLH